MSIKKIWIDGYEANQPNRVGSGQYAFEILRNLEKIDIDNDYTILLPSRPLDDLPQSRTGWKYRILKPPKLWTRITLPVALYLTKARPDLFFSPAHYIPRFSPVKRVCTIFDLSFLHFPEMFGRKDLWQLKNWTKFSILNAGHIITISNFSKKDIVENYQVDKEKISVCYPGYDNSIFQPIKNQPKIRKVLKRYGISSPYIIYIGTIQPRKNLIRLIEAFSRVILSDSDGSQDSEPRDSSATPQNDRLQLVIVGKTTEPGRQGWKYKDVLDTPKRLDVEDKVIFTGFAPTEDLPYLLAGAQVFVLPSLWEGFGIPVLEAMATSIAVAASNVSSLPEVAGAAGTFFDPYSVESIQEALETLLENSSLREKKVQLGLKRVKEFSWQSCARETLKVFEKL